MRIRDRLSLWVVVVAVVAAVAPLYAQEQDGAAETVTAAVPTAPVEVDGTTLFTVRGISSYPAEERAAAIADKILQVARNPEVDPASLTLVEEESVTWIQAGTTRITAVVDADARLEGVKRHELALVVLGRIRHAIVQYRLQRTGPVLLANGVRALAATAVLAAALALLLWLRRRLDRGLAGRIERHARSLGIDTLKAGTSTRVGELLRGTLRTVRSLSVLALLLVYLHIVSGLFPWTRPVHARLAAWTVEPLRTMGRGVLNAIPDLIFLVILVYVTRWGLKLIRIYFEAVHRGSVVLSGFDPDWALPTFKIVRLVVIAFAAVVAYPYIPGSSTAAFKGVSLFAGVVFSLGSSSVISNLIAGYTMTYRRAFRVGDRIRVGSVVGDVTDIRLQVTHVRTPKNEEVIVPNSEILNSEVTNFSSLARTDGLILHTTVGIGYETPWRQVEAMLLLAAERTPGALHEPAPFVLHKALDDFCVVYELNVYTDRPGAMNAQYTDLHRNILDVFNEFGVQIMTPAYEGDPERPKLVPRESWYRAPAAPPECEPSKE